MTLKTITIDFGQFDFPDDHTVIATAQDGVEIDTQKVQQAIAIVMYSGRDFLPNNMKQRIFGGTIEKFNSIKDAHHQVESIFSN